jgi:hypothetical protein
MGHTCLRRWQRTDLLHRFQTKGVAREGEVGKTVAFGKGASPWVEKRLNRLGWVATAAAAGGCSAGVSKDNLVKDKDEQK